jgi:hypothetical protein
MQIETVDPMFVIGTCFILGGICLVGLYEIATKPPIVLLEIIDQKEAEYETQLEE